MLRRQRNQRLTVAGEDWAADDHERASAGLDDASECSIEFAFIRGVHEYNFLSEGAARLLHFARLDDRFREIWINQCGNDAGPGNQLTQHLDALRAEPVAEERQTRQVTARPVAGSKSRSAAVSSLLSQL